MYMVMNFAKDEKFSGYFYHSVSFIPRLAGKLVMRIRFGVVQGEGISGIPFSLQLPMRE